MIGWVQAALLSLDSHSVVGQGHRLQGHRRPPHTEVGRELYLWEGRVGAIWNKLSVAGGRLVSEEVRPLEGSLLLGLEGAWVAWVLML